MCAQFVGLSDDDLKQKVATFRDLLPTSTNEEARNNFLATLEIFFKNCDKDGNGQIDRTEFEKMIEGYF